MRRDHTDSVVHLELHTQDSAEVRAFFWHLLGWRSRRVGEAGGSYLELSVGSRLGGGIVQCGRRPSAWLPYIRVGNVYGATERASELGASVLLAPREGPYGWRAIVSNDSTGDLALWQPKTGRLR